MTEQPNILFIYTDQQHIDTIAALGCPYLQTPGMDRLVRQGTSFSQSYCPSPLCGPCRAAVYTGRMASEVGVTDNGARPEPGVPFMGEWLRKQAGYETVYMGKWHVPQYFTSNVPGFDVLFGGRGGPGALSDNSYTFAADAFLRQYDGSKPFLMALNYMQPHDICEWMRLNQDRFERLPFPDLEHELPPLPDNFDIPDPEPALVRKVRAGSPSVQGGWDERHWRYYRWAYHRHVEMVDAEIGRVLDALDASPHRENTLILFSSDHGEGLAHHQMTRKSFLYEEAAKVPLIVSWPGRLPQDVRDDHTLVTGVDLVPTMCDFAGIDPPPKARGLSLRPLLENGQALARTFVTSEIADNRGQMLRSSRYKYIAYLDDPTEQLFDLKDDPGETRNLAGDAACASVLQDHRDMHRQWVGSLEVSPRVAHRWYESRAQAVG